MDTEHDAEYYFNSALEKIDARDVQGGLADLNQAILLSPTNIEYYVERARLLFFALEQQSATEDYNRVFQLQLQDLNTIIELGSDLGDLAFAHDRRALFFGQLGQRQEQLAELDWLVDHGCTDISTYRQRASCEFRLGQFENALRDYTAILQLDPDYVDAVLGRAQSYYSIQHYQEALDELNKILSLKNQHPNYLSIIFSWRARTYYKLDKENEAREDFIKSTELAGGTPLDISALDYMRILFSED